MLGARSVVFAPLKNLGLIIVDEEHEPSYKQDQKPAYQTRDVAIQRGKIANAVVLFGSATPSLEVYYSAQKGDVRLLELRERIVNRPLPAIRIVDPQQRHKHSKILSEPLMTSLTRVLARREQSIVFLNRRGFAPGVMCQKCNSIWQCPQCSVSLVYHKDPEKLHCHYCDFQQPWPGICPACGSKELTIFGVGTQKVEEEMKKLFPQARIFRLDRDTASKKGVYETIYEDFKQENVDILLGTQMVAKGFDFPRVTLVGVIDADTALYLPDFRSAERTFQLITQVAGRSGRGDLGGEVVVQSKHPEHYALAAAVDHDYHRFYRQEIQFREQLRYPPFCRLTNFLVRSKKEEKAAEAATFIGNLLQEYKNNEFSHLDILGPTQAARYKMYNFFRWQILVKGDISTLLTVGAKIKDQPLPSGVLLSIDVDPQDTL
jgi:primosomal protein N' (replication factor Y)